MAGPELFVITEFDCKLQVSLAICEGWGLINLRRRVSKPAFPAKTRFKKQFSLVALVFCPRIFKTANNKGHLYITHRTVKEFRGHSNNTWNLGVGVENNINKCREGGGGLKLAKHCHVLFEWPIAPLNM